MKIQFRAFHGPTDWVWCNEQVGILQVEDTSGIMAIDLDTGERVGACIMDNWTPNSVQAHFMLASTMVLRHGFLQECFGYIFNHAGKKVMYGLVPADNAKALAINKHMGFVEVLRMPEAFKDGVDYIVCQLKREDCKYMPVGAEHG